MDWFDHALWQLEGHGEYRDPIPPADLIEKFPAAIWPGLMPPDFLPLLGNMAGDWLCMRLGRQGEVAEIVQWYHGGGDWIPWGKSLAEAIAFDAASQSLPGISRRHAVPAEPTRASNSIANDPLLAWAVNRLPAEIGSRILAGSNGEGGPLAQQMIDYGIAEVALRSESIQRLLSDSELSQLDVGNGASARWGVSRLQLNEWLFDFDRLPDNIRTSMIGNRQPLQNWDAAAQHCRRVIQIAPHLAWGWDILGYVATRSGQFVSAANYFAQGLSRSVFTDQSIRLRTHWKTPQAGKFSAAMLQELIDSGRVTASDFSGDFDAEYLRALCADEDSRQSLVTEYWLARSERSSLAGDHAAAFDHAYAAGWDLGAASLAAYGSVLDRLIELAMRTGNGARAELARTHRHCLRDRLGI